MVSKKVLDYSEQLEEIASELQPGKPASIRLISRMKTIAICLRILSKQLALIEKEFDIHAHDPFEDE